MRTFVLVVVVLTLVVSTSTGEARGRRPSRHSKTAKRVATDMRADAVDLTSRPVPRWHGQSVGAPWAGHLDNPTRLRGGDGFMIRRPWRAFGTRTTVELVRRAVSDTVEMFPNAHVLAIGDLSAEHGGGVTEHHSHQTGRDADLGLIYKKKPADFPHNFIAATAENLDCGATWRLLSAFATTAEQDGGAQVIFLDFKVQGLLYNWAKDHDVSIKRLDRLFQFPHGRGASEGLIRHEPNHGDHMHVRFKCAHEDPDCR